MRFVKSTLKLCVQCFKYEGDFALQAAALAYRGTPQSVTGYPLYFLVTRQKALLPLFKEQNELALCLTGVTWLEALQKSRQAVLQYNYVAADASARAVKKQKTRLVESSVVALCRTVDERKNVNFMCGAL